MRGRRNVEGMQLARSPGLVALAAVSLLVPLACGGGAPDAKASFSESTGGAGAPTKAPPAANAPPPATPLGTVYTTDPNALASLLAAAAAAGSAWLGPAAAGASDPAEAGLRAAAAQYAPGMAAEGPVAKGSLAEGGHIDFVVNINPSRCYAIVAYGAGLADLDVNLLAPPFYNLLAGQDGLAGPTAVIGASPRPMCPMLPVAVPYKVDLHAKHGSGSVAAQLFSKPR